MVHITYSPDKGSLAIRHRLYALSTRAVNLVAERRVCSENRPELIEPSDGRGSGRNAIVRGPSVCRRTAGGSPSFRGLAAAARDPRMKVHASDGTGSHEPEEDRGAQARGDEAKAGDDHAFAHEVPEVRADHEQEHEGDDDRGDRRVPKVEEGERDDREESGQQRGDPVDQRAQDRRELERLLVFLAEPREHRPLDRADVEFLLDAFRFVGADRATHREGDRGADRCGEDQRLVRLRCADRVRADDDPEDREGSVERTDHEVATDDRPDIRDFVVLPNSATPGPEIHVIRSGSQVSRGWSVRVVPRRLALDRGLGSSPERNRVSRRLCPGTPARRIGGSRRRRPGRRGRERRPSGHPSALWPTGWRSLSSRRRSPSTWTS